MKKAKSAALLSVLYLLLLCACGQTVAGPEAEPSQGPTWQEQYDLGVRYLSEGNYEEAILAFTAAIEIDPKWAPAYVGRGDAYVLSGEAERNLAAAKADYETAIELDETSAEAYLGLADVYIRQGDYEKALEILRKGLGKTGDTSIEKKLGEVEETVQYLAPPEEEQQSGKGTVSFSGTGHNMSLSLTYPGLPKEVWMVSDEYRVSAGFDVSISDGHTTFRVGTSIHGIEEPSGMVVVPEGALCKNWLGVAHWNEYDAEHYVWTHLRTSVSVSRNGDTLTWNFTMPEQGFSVSDIQYIGYRVFYSDVPFSFEDRSHTAYETGTFQLQDGQLIYLNDGLPEDMGFLISEEESRKFWDN